MNIIYHVINVSYCNCAGSPSHCWNWNVYRADMIDVEWFHYGGQIRRLRILLGLIEVHFEAADDFLRNPHRRRLP